MELALRLAGRAARVKDEQWVFRVLPAQDDRSLFPVAAGKAEKEKAMVEVFAAIVTCKASQTVKSDRPCLPAG